MQGLIRGNGVRLLNPERLLDKVDNGWAGDKTRSLASVSVIIPTLNEAGNLPFVLNTIPHWVDEVIVVDGRSDDDTERIAKVLRPDVRIVHQKVRGKGSALRAGFDAARGEMLIALDADGSMDGSDIASFGMRCLAARTSPRAVVSCREVARPTSPPFVDSVTVKSAS